VWHYCYNLNGLELLYNRPSEDIGFEFFEISSLENHWLGLEEFATRDFDELLGLMLWGATSPEFPS